MTRRVNGTLTNANGTPLAGFVLSIVAVQSTPATVAAGSALEVTLGEAGEYDVALLDGRYRVSVRAGGPEEFRPRTELGLVTVTAGPAIDLLTLIGAPGIDQSDVQHLIDEALAYIAQAEDARDAAQLAQSGAEGWSDLARDWATKTDGEVAGAGYSAKHHAQAAASSALAASGSASAASGSALAASGSASTAGDKANEAAGSADLARDWATKLGVEVAPGEGYSAKHHADAAAGSALAASGSASAASGSALAASGSAGTATIKAQDSANAAALAQDWAEGTGEVEAGAYSAKHHAQAAAGSATQAAVSYADFERRYLGEKSAPPSTDNAGAPLVTGALYWDTTEASLRLWDGAHWVDATGADVRVLADQQLMWAVAYATEKVGVVARAVAGGAVNLSAGTASIPSLTSSTDVATGLFFPAPGVLGWATAGLERMRLTADGRLGIGTTAPSGALDVADNRIRIRTSQTPASATAAGNAGDIAWDSGHIYVCIATNTWRRAALATW